MSDAGFERDLTRLRAYWRIASSISSPQPTLRRDTFMDMNDTTDTTASPTLGEIYAAVKKGVEEVAKEHDIAPAALLGEVLATVVTATAARRAAKRGDVAKTVLYTSVLIRHTITWNSRKSRLVAARAHADAMALRRVTFRTSVKEPM